MRDTSDTQRTVDGVVRVRVSAYLELVRPRIALLVAVTTLLGFHVALPGGWEPSSIARLLHTLLGTTMIAAGANALNQYIEAALDGRMVRTAQRPIPSGRLSRREVLVFGVLTSVWGVTYLTAQVNQVAGLLGGVTLVSYVLVYTPLKRATWRSVFVGAVSGGMPPLIGWAGATGSLAAHAWLLFGIVYFWQLPHFAAISWLYREDYGRAGYPVLSVVDPSGKRTVRHILTHSMLLLAVSVLPAVVGMTGPVYGAGAVALGLAFLLCGIGFARDRSAMKARHHLLASVMYLPALCGLMIICREL